MIPPTISNESPINHTNATHLKIGRKLCRKSNGVGNGIIYMVRRDSRRQRADLRAQEERTPLVRAHRQHRKKKHGLHLLEPLLHITAIRYYIRHFDKLR